MMEPNRVNFQSSVRSQPLVQPLEMENTEFESQPYAGGINKMLGLIAVVVILLGVGSGWVLAQNYSGTGVLSEDSKLSDSKTVKNGTGQVMEEGIKDEKLFPDKTEGELQVNDGKLTQEGTHILVRPGGVSQTVYLTSSAVDLGQFVGKNVEIWGQTNSAQKAGWLMEVGYIKVK